MSWTLNLASKMTHLLPSSTAQEYFLSLSLSLLIITIRLEFNTGQATIHLVNEPGLLYTQSSTQKQQPKPYLGISPDSTTWREGCGEHFMKGSSQQVNVTVQVLSGKDGAFLYLEYPNKLCMTVTVLSSLTCKSMTVTVLLQSKWNDNSIAWEEDWGMLPPYWPGWSHRFYVTWPTTLCHATRKLTDSSDGTTSLCKIVIWDGVLWFWSVTDSL